MRYLLIFLAVYSIGPLFLWLTGRVDLKGNYLTADRTSAQIAPSPESNPEAIIQVYAARAFNWRGLFSVHTWVAFKRPDAEHYEVLQVIGWRMFHGLPTFVMEQDIPDRRWFNAKPALLLEIRGSNAAKLIPKIITAARSYPYSNQYSAWPGPNSNTFTAFIARQVPELGLVLPPNAVGKDYLGKGIHIAKAPSNTGWQVSLYGLFGILVAKKEGLELTLLGLVIGINPLDLSISLPGIGRIGPPRMGEVRVKRK